MGIVKKKTKKRSVRQGESSMESNDDSESGTVAAVDRAIDVLLAFQPGDKVLTLAQLAERTGLYKSTIIRLARTLERRDFVSRASEGGYKPGPALLNLGIVFQKSFPVSEIVMPQLIALAETTSVSASFFISNGFSKTCLFRAEPRIDVRHNVQVGETHPLHQGATGKIFEIFADGIGTKAENRMHAVPTVSIGKEPFDISAIAGPLFGPNEELLGAISISGPANRFDARAQQIAAKFLLQTLASLTSKLGGNPSVFNSTSTVLNAKPKNRRKPL